MRARLAGLARRAAHTPKPGFTVTDRPLAFRPLAALAALLVAATGGCSLQAGGGLTHEQGEEIIAELKAIHRSLDEQTAKMGGDAQPARAGHVQVADSELQAMGAAAAPLTLVEFTDYQCPYCKRFHDTSWPELKKKYVDTGKLRYVVRDLPLDFHSQAMPAAIAARCAGQQGQFWPVHEALFNEQAALGPDMIQATAKRYGVGSEAFERCRQDPRVRQAIEADVAEAQQIGVNGTPGFVLGVRKSGKVEGTLIVGAQSAATFEAKIEALLAAP